MLVLELPEEDDTASCDQAESDDDSNHNARDLSGIDRLGFRDWCLEHKARICWYSSTVIEPVDRG